MKKSVLEFPFDNKYIMRNKIAIKNSLSENTNFIEKRIAILGGSTTHHIKDVLEIFLLYYGIKPVFYESDYKQYWNVALFNDEILSKFNPDIIYVHTSSRNIDKFPKINESQEEIDNLLNKTFEYFSVMWQSIQKNYSCPIIQNNFEYPYYRILGNKEANSPYGKVNFITKLNLKLYEYANEHKNFYINDINYQSSDFGLKEWSNPLYWNMYKYSLSFDAIPTLAYNVANIIKSVFGKNKKAIAVDLDNTLWGGVISEDGIDNIELGQETPLGESYLEFQEYLKNLQQQGIILNIISKNDMDIALTGLQHQQMILKKDDFINIKCNWEPKNKNLVDIANDLSLLPESFVFIDDNPAERELIKQTLPQVAVPNIGSDIENFMGIIDRAGYFEVTEISDDDKKRHQMYVDNKKRKEQELSFNNYEDYLISLDMKAEIKPFAPIYYSRISQLTNKSNQFNLTTKRYTKEEIKNYAENPNYITLYGRLKDCFGDNGIVSLVIGEKKNDNLDIILWLMSCRVLKRNFEFAMMDTLISTCLNENFKSIKGYYYPTSKNNMVKNFYDIQGFEKISEKQDGFGIWQLNIDKNYQLKNNIIKVNTENDND